MHTQANLTLDVDVLLELRKRAERLGCPIGELASLALKGGLARLNDEALAAWVGGLESKRGRNAGAMGKNEKIALKAFTEIKAADKWSGRAFSELQISRACGLHRRDAYDALIALRSRGYVEGLLGDDLDRWGRSKASVWWLKADAMPGVDQRLARDLIEGIRTELTRMTVEPLAHGLIVGELRGSCGWSEQALAIPDGRFPSYGSTSFDLTATDSLTWLRGRWPYKVPK